jgi:hypothetical protein
MGDIFVIKSKQPLLISSYIADNVLAKKRGDF